MKPNIATALKERIEATSSRRMTVGDLLEISRRYRHRAALFGALAERASEFDSSDAGPARFLLADGAGRQEAFASEVVEAAQVELRNLAEQARVHAKQVAALVVDVPSALADVALDPPGSTTDSESDTVKPNHIHRSGR